MEKKYISVRFKTTNKTYTFSCSDATVKCGDFVVVETVRGLECAEVVSDLMDSANVSTEIKEIIHKANQKEIDQSNKNVEDAKQAKITCQEESDKLNLGMNIISAEYTLDRSKITFIYLADDRVDFRELLKVLASIFHCRIDLRQVGTRDKAKMVSGIGVCGRELCCSKFIGDFDRVSINMAKNQLLALNTQKLSGQCGNLMCCLRFEDDAYTDLKEGLPKLNSIIDFDGEKLKMTSMNVINKTCKLENADHAFFTTFEELMQKGKWKKVTKEENEEEQFIQEQ